MVYMAMLLFAVLIFGKILYIQLVEGNHWKEKASVVDRKSVV